MQNSLKIKQILHKFCLVIMLNLVKMQENDYRCLQFKKMIFEDIKTFSFFHPDAQPISYTEDKCTSAGGFVVGGENAQPKEFPFAARLGNMANNNNGHVNWFCGGTLLSEYFVLTAAHCFYAALGDVNRVRLGELDFDSTTDDADPQDFGVQQLIEHPQYNNDEPYNDIALVRLSSAVKFNRYKHPACLPISNEDENSNSFTAIGWGHVKFGGPSSPYLQKVTLKPYSYSSCKWLAEGAEGKERLPAGLKDSQLCAGSTEAKDTCQGDSGGALVKRHSKYPCMYNVVGITSTGVGGCALPNVPALYTRVRYYIDWISYYVY